MRRALIGSVAASLLLASSAGAAATIQVTSNLDDGTDCTLREALASAEGNADSGGCTHTGTYDNDTIMFDPADFPPAPLTPTVIQTTGGEYVITGGGDLDIVGPGMDALEIRATGGASRIFNMNVSGQDISISGLSATMVNASGDVNYQGGAITNFADLELFDVRVSNNLLSATSSTPGGDAVARGAGIYNGSSATLILDHSVVSENGALAENTAVDPNSDATARGGGIYSEGSLDLRFTTIDDNLVSADDADNGVSEASGGGVRTANGGVDVDHSTISRNDAVAITTGSGAGAIARAQGGGLHIAGPGGRVELSTIAENTVDTIAVLGNPVRQGGGLLVDSVTSPVNPVSGTIARNDQGGGGGANVFRDTGAAADVTAQNTIIADPVGPTTFNCNEVLTSNGFNIDYPDTDVTPPGSCGLGMGTDLTSNPLLDPNLQDNGGETETIAVLTGSPAIDAGSNAGQTLAFANEDQRELTRPSNFPAIPDAFNGTDIGAFEAQAPAPQPGAAPTPWAPAAGPTGLRSAALKRCAKINNKQKKKKCKKRARRLPV